MIASLLVARLMGPYLTGIWTGLKVILSYADNFSLGLRHGMNLELPRLLAIGDRDACERVKNTTFWTSIVMVVCIALGIVLWFICAKERLSKVSLLGVLTIASLTLLQEIQKYYTSLFRIEGRIGIVSLVNACMGFASLSLIALLVTFFSIYGLYLAVFAAGLAAAFFLASRNGFRPARKVDYKTAFGLLALGLPVLCLSILASVVSSVDKLVVLRFLGTAQLGYYSIAGFFGSSIMYLPDALNFILLPRLVAQTSVPGHKDRVREDVFNAVKFLSLFFPMIVGALYIAVPSLITLLLPKYGPSIGPTRIILIAMFFAVIGGLCDTFLVSQRSFLTIAFGKITALIAAGLVFAASLHYRLGSEGIAFGMLVLYLVSGNWSMLFSLKKKEEGFGAAWKRLYSIYMPFMVCLAGILCSTALSTLLAGWLRFEVMRALAAFFAFTACLVPLFLRAEKQYKLLDAVKQWRIGRQLDFN